MAVAALEQPYLLKPLAGVKPKGAIVLGADYRGLGIVRNLGRRGIPVWVVKDKHTLAAHSRYVQRVLDWSLHDDEDQMDRLEALGRQAIPGEWALFPTTDQMTSLIGRNHDRLSWYFSLTTPGPEVVEVGQDKRRTHALACACGIDFPTTWLFHDLAEVDTADFAYPVIIKPATKERLNPLTRDKAWPVDNRSELISAFRAACALLPPEEIMIQDVIPGDGRFQFSYAGVMNRGRPVAHVVARRLRQYPADFGIHSTYVRSVDDPEVEAAGRRIVEALNYTGLIEIEFKRDPRDLSLKLLDINTRVWGWHTIGVRSGVDFAHVNWRLLQGEDVRPLRVPSGQTWMRFLTDTATSVQQIRAGRSSPSSYLNTLLHRHDRPIQALDDPWPTLLEGPTLACLQWKRSRA